ncbi:hypothetical protein SAMN05518672_113145 [Chitinophaga sp. CF118]|uniref:hypothetical protein n=1 Tax=Chitinophaga sp. CF118 TaxID=1884367 RepID=UPI0008EC6609|nr:hypothetical protein [Chitinophaga sp. CF118]SFE98238.1 hypothetical protein SAMN05518672_113145 [Chitinophaga sp. CF118]
MKKAKIMLATIGVFAGISTTLALRYNIAKGVYTHYYTPVVGASCSITVVGLFQLTTVPQPNQIPTYYSSIATNTCLKFHTVMAL